MLRTLQEKNPSLDIKCVCDTSFKPFGNIVEGYDFSEVIAIAEEFPMPASGNSYVAEIQGTEELSINKIMASKFYGEMPIQIGMCWGKNLVLNGLEWHKGNEVVVALTDTVVMLCLMDNIIDGKIDTKNVETFYVKKGQVVELYATSLHYCPCNVDENGFKTLVILPLGTNLPLAERHECPVLFAKNKWLYVHEENIGDIQAGAYVGLAGENLKLEI